MVVPEDQLSLAIGRRGQNARLASRLTEWRIDIVGEREAGEALRSQAVAEIFKEEEPASDEEGGIDAEVAEAPVQSIIGMTPRVADTLREHGYESVQSIADATVEALIELPNLGVKTAEKVIDSARQMMGLAEEATEDAGPEEGAAPEEDAAASADDQVSESAVEEEEPVAPMEDGESEAEADSEEE